MIMNLVQEVIHAKSTVNLLELIINTYSVNSDSMLVRSSRIVGIQILQDSSSKASKIMNGLISGKLIAMFISVGTASVQTQNRLKSNSSASRVTVKKSVQLVKLKSLESEPMKVTQSQQLAPLSSLLVKNHKSLTMYITHQKRPQFLTRCQEDLSQYLVVTR